MRSKLVFFGIVAFSTLVIMAVGCNSNSTSPYGGSGGGNSGGTPPKNTVNLTDYAFNPPSLTITRGTTVTWNNTSGLAHTSTSDNGAWDTGNIAAGSSATTTFNTAGTFSYHCTYHAAMGMVGSITVQ